MGFEITGYEKNRISEVISVVGFYKDSLRFLEESGCIVARLMKTVDFSKGNYETKSSELANQMRNVEFYLKKSYRLLRLAAGCSKIARTSVKVGKTRLLPLVLLRVQERISEQAFSCYLSGWALMENF